MIFMPVIGLIPSKNKQREHSYTGGRSGQAETYGTVKLLKPLKPLKP
jgi:hypothetical protein